MILPEISSTYVGSVKITVCQSIQVVIQFEYQTKKYQAQTR